MGTWTLQDLGSSPARSTASHEIPLESLRSMPEISRFLGIVVRMHYHDHLPPHFHASDGDYAIVVQLDTWIVEGRFPPRALRHVLEWAELHREELRDDWARAASHADRDGPW